MARIRSVHPGQWTDVNFVSCSPHARLLALALRNEADDRGVFVWEPLQLKMRVLPADNVDVAALLDELLKHNQVRKFADESSKEYGVIRNFRRWQRPEKPKVVYPLPTELISYVGRSPKDRIPDEDDRRQVADRSGNLSPEGAEGGSRTRTREREPKDGSQAVQPTVLDNNYSLSSFDEASVRAENQRISSPGAVVGVSEATPTPGNIDGKHYLLKALDRKRVGK